MEPPLILSDAHFHGLKRQPIHQYIDGDDRRHHLCNVKQLSDD